MNSYTIVNTVNRQNRPSLLGSAIQGYVEYGHVLLEFISDGVSYHPSLIPYIIIDVCGTIYFKLTGTCTPPESVPIEYIKFYLPVPSNESVFVQTGLDYTPIRNPSILPHIQSFSVEYPFIDYGKPSDTTVGILTYYDNHTFILRALPTFTTDTIKSITGTIIWSQIQ